MCAASAIYMILLHYTNSVLCRICWNQKCIIRTISIFTQKFRSLLSSLFYLQWVKGWVYTRTISVFVLAFEQEIGDVENWARSIEMDMRTIATALEYVHKGQLQSASSWTTWWNDYCWNTGIKQMVIWLLYQQRCNQQWHCLSAHPPCLGYCWWLLCSKNCSKYVAFHN